MAHELTSTDHMVSGSNVTPWHGLGTVVAGNLKAAAALTAAKLDWNVVQESVFDGDMVEIPTHKLNRRSDNREVLGVVSRDWTPVQNEQLLEIAEALAQVDGAEFRPVIETAGSLRGGRIVWAMVRIGERKFAGSEHRSYLLLSNGHDGTRALRGTLTDVRVVCANTLRWAETSAASLYVSHAKGVETRLKNALNMLGWANDATKSTFAIYEALAATPVAADKASAIFRSLVVDPTEKYTEGKIAIVDRMLALYRRGKGNEGRSAFDVLNAVTDWIDHERAMRPDKDQAEKRFIFAALGGEGDRLKSAAFKAVRGLITA